MARGGDFEDANQKNLPLDEDGFFINSRARRLATVGVQLGAAYYKRSTLWLVRLYTIPTGPVAAPAFSPIKRVQIQTSDGDVYFIQVDDLSSNPGSQLANPATSRNPIYVVNGSTILVTAFSYTDADVRQVSVGFIPNYFATPPTGAGPSVAERDSLTANVTTQTQYIPAGAGVDTIIAAANPNRLTLSVYNPGTSTMLLRWDAAPGLTLTSLYTVLVPPGGYFEAPYSEATRELHALWPAVTGSDFANVDEGTL